MEHKETGCQAPEGPILCINNCGFFGSAATMNMCSKCHKEMIMKQEQAKLAASSIDSIINGSDAVKEHVMASNAAVAVAQIEVQTVNMQPVDVAGPSEGVAMIPKGKEGPNRCSTCRKRVGLTGFNCRCGNLYCSLHRYSDKHDCKFDYRTAARDAIAKANPVVKAEKLRQDLGVPTVGARKIATCGTSSCGFAALPMPFTFMFAATNFLFGTAMHGAHFRSFKNRRLCIWSVQMVCMLAMLCKLYLWSVLLGRYCGFAFS